MKLLQG